MKRLVTYVAASLAGAGGAVRVEESAGPGGTRLILRVEPEVRGRIIGRDGRTVRAIRTLAAATGRKLGRSVTVEVAE